MANYIVTVMDADDQPMAGLVAWADNITLTPETAEPLAQLILKNMFPTLDVYALKFYGTQEFRTVAITVDVVEPASGVILMTFLFVAQPEVEILQ